MIDKKDKKSRVAMKVLKVFGICSAGASVIIVAFIVSLVLIKNTTGQFPNWISDKVIQTLSFEGEAQATPMPVPEIVYKNPYEQTDDMRILSLYIRGRVRNTPIEVADRIAYEVCKQSAERGIPYELTIGIIEVESMWNPRAKSEKDARGLMQALIEDGVVIEKEKLYGIEYNINIGLQILISKIKRCKGSLSKALYCYVGGDDEYKELIYAAMGRFLLYKLHTMEEL